MSGLKDFSQHHRYKKIHHVVLEYLEGEKTSSVVMSQYAWFVVQE